MATKKTPAAPKAKRPRGRPRKNPAPPPPPAAETIGTGPAVAIEDPPSAPTSMYLEEYEGRKWWLCGIKVDSERQQLPFHRIACGGHSFQQGTQRVINTADGYRGLAEGRERVCRALLSFHQVKEIVAGMKNRVVRWNKLVHDDPAEGGGTERKIRWRADVVNLTHQLKTVHPQTGAIQHGGYRFTPADTDIPVSNFLVFVRRDKIKNWTPGFMPSIDSLPSVLELDPTVVSDRQPISPRSGGDEPW